MSTSVFIKRGLSKRVQKPEVYFRRKLPSMHFYLKQGYVLRLVYGQDGFSGYCLSADGKLCIPSINSRPLLFYSLSDALLHRDNLLMEVNDLYQAYVSTDDRLKKMSILMDAFSRGVVGDILSAKTSQEYWDLKAFPFLYWSGGTFSRVS